VTRKMGKPIAQNDLRRRRDRDRERERSTHTCVCMQVWLVVGCDFVISDGPNDRGDYLRTSSFFLKTSLLYTPSRQLHPQTGEERLFRKNLNYKRKGPTPYQVGRMTTARSGMVPYVNKTQQNMEMHIWCCFAAILFRLFLQLTLFKYFQKID